MTRKTVKKNENSERRMKTVRENSEKRAEKQCSVEV